MWERILKIMSQECEKYTCYNCGKGIVTLAINVGKKFENLVTRVGKNFENHVTI